MEIADLYVVNKADRDGADQMAASVTAMLQMSLTTPEWVPPVTLTAAHTGRGIEELWDKLQEHRAYLETSGNLSKRRGEHRTQEFLEVVEEELVRRLRRHGADRSRPAGAVGACSLPRSGAVFGCIGIPQRFRPQPGTPDHSFPLVGCFCLNCDLPDSGISMISSIR